MILPQLVLPWPVPPLWPNARRHRQVVAAHRADQRRVAHALACEKGWHRLNVAQGVIEIDLYFCPPSRRSFDVDNALAAMKGALDGLSDACRVDDQWFSPRLHRGGPCKDGGVIVIAAATGQPWRRIDALAKTLVQRAGMCQKKDGAEGATNANDP